MDDQTSETVEVSHEERRSEASDPSSTPQAEDKGARRPLLRWVWRIGGAVILLAAIGFGVRYWLNSRHFAATDDAFIDAYTTKVAPQVAGRVTALKFSDNQHVTAGQVLLTIDPRDFQARLDLAKAQLSSAMASVEQSRAQVVLQQANADQARANVRVGEADLLQARQDYERFTQISPRAVSRQQVDNATALFHSAEAKRDASRQAVVGAEAQLKAAGAQVLAADASVKQAQSNVAAAELQLSYCTILAPVAGTVAHRTVDVGNYVNPGQAMFALVQDERWVTANFKETQLADIHPGQPVDIVVDAVPDTTFHGKVDSFQPGTGSAFSVLPAENATGNYVKIVQRLPVKIVFDDDRVRDARLSPGMSVQPKVRVR